MEIDEFLQFIDLESERLNSRFPTLQGRERILARAVKLNEEVGELCSEVLASSGDQRKEKLANYNEHTLQAEFADVVITTLLLAKSMNVDVPKAIEIKIDAINKRYNEV